MNNKVIKGTVWTSVSTIVVALVQILRLAILARYLEKSDFGIVAIVTFVLGLTHTFCDMGFGSAIMHKQDLDKEDFSSLYWLQFLVFIVMYVVICTISYPVSLFYNEPVLTILIPIALLDLIFKGFGQLYETLLLKTFQFKKIAIRNIVASVLSLFLAVVLAVQGWGVYSLIYSTLFNTILLNLWNLYLGKKEMPVIRYCSFMKVKPLVKIGVYQTGTQILDYISSKIDVLLIGRLLGPADLGVYNLAKELVLKVVQVINSIANRVALPYLSSIQKNMEGLRNAYSKLLSLISVITVPVCSIVGCLSVPVVYILYGNRYLELAPITALFSAWAIISCFGNPIGNVIVATGRTDVSFKYTIIRMTVYIPFTYLLASYSLYAVAIGQILLAIFSLLLSWYMSLYKIIGLSLKHFLKSFISTTIFAILIIAPAYYSIENNILGLPANSIIQIIFYGAIIMVMFGGYIYLTKKRTFLYFIHAIKGN